MEFVRDFLVFGFAVFLTLGLVRGLFDYKKLNNLLSYKSYERIDNFLEGAPVIALLFLAAYLGWTGAF